MHPLKGKKQSAEHISKRTAAMKRTCYASGIWKGGRPPKYTPERLWAKIQKRDANECWPWQGYRSDQGYGRVEIGGRIYYAHRVIYDLAHPGEITRESPGNGGGFGIVRHSCDNPICCNPAHLLIGTHADNMQDKVRRGRQWRFRKDGTHPRARLSADDVRWIRFLYERGFATQKALALLYDVGKSVISLCILRKTYAEVD